MRYTRIVTGGRIISAAMKVDGGLIGSDGREYNPKEVTWLPPVSPSKIIGVVLNYGEHAGELGLTTGEEPVLFFKPLSSMIGNRGAIVYPRGAKYMHYEAELAVVIARPARRVSQDRAFSFVKGYTIANDVTVRDFVTNTFRPPVKAKGFDTFCPIGPCVVTIDEVPDITNLGIITKVNGQIRQQGNTQQLIHSVPKIIEFITEFMTLEPEDLILTGTPKGISPIVPGDKIEITIDNLGTLESMVVSDEEVMS